MSRREPVLINITKKPSSNPYKIWMSNHLLTSYQIEPSEKIWLRFGSERLLVTCEANFDDNVGLIQLQSDLVLNHPLPAPNRVYMASFSREYKELRIGPIVAMLVEKSSSQPNPFGNISDFAYELHQYCLQHHSDFYLFSIDDVEQQHINGYRYHENDWVQEIVPYPDIIYNRISSRTLEHSENVLNFFVHCQEYGIPYFNDRFLSKWDVFNILVDQDLFAAHLPKTIKVIDKKIIESVLNTYPTTFLKPIHGREGRGILRITREMEDKYEMEASKALNPPLPTVSKEGVLQFIEQFVPCEQYILQQGIELIKYREGKVDFRILCNRNEYGIWCVTSSTARVGLKDHIVTNVAMGAAVHPVHVILEDQFIASTAKLIRSKLFELAIEICKTIDENSDGLFGEFGIDFGVDVQGHPWILEVNTKPSKHERLSPYSSEIRPSAKGIFLFANYLYTSQEHMKVSIRKE